MSLLLIPAPVRALGAADEPKVLGLVFLLVIVSLIGFTIAIYNKVFETSVPLKLRTGSIGNQLILPADVKLRGILVGQVRALSSVTALFLARVHQRQQADTARTARTAVLAAARASAVDLLSYDYHHLDADFAKAKSHLTGPFAQEYADTSSKVVQPTATEFQAVVTASVAAAAVKTASASSAVVLAFVNQTSQNTKVPAPHVDQNRVRLTMTTVHGQWLVSKLEAL